MTSVSLALGAGGARGVAHIFVLEALDELGIKVAEISGCSVGAVVGAMYAAGMSGRDIRRHLVASGPHWQEAAIRLFFKRCIQFTPFGRSTSDRGVLNPIRLVKTFVPENFPKSFDELGLPFHAIATDLYRDESVTFSSGDLWLAVAASLAYPGFVHPVRHDGAVLVDGAVLNPIPLNVLDKSRAPIIAVDLSVALDPNKRRSPFATAMAAAGVMGRHISKTQLSSHPPALVLRPEMPEYGSMQFHRIGEMLDGFKPFKAKARRAIESAILDSAAAA